jgi:hypothetical protein
LPAPRNSHHHGISITTELPPPPGSADAVSLDHG